MLRQNRPAAIQDFDCDPIFISVQHVLQHVNAGARRNFVTQIGTQQLASIGKPLVVKSRRCRSNGFRIIDQHAIHIGKSIQNGGNQRTSTSAQVGHDGIEREVPGTRNRHVILRRHGTHDGAEDG